MKKVSSVFSFILAVAVSMAACVGSESVSDHTIMDAFTNTTASADPMTRAWWPDAGAGSSAEGLALTAQHIRDMSAAGFGGMEIAYLSDQLDNVPQSSTLPANQRLGQPGVDQSQTQTHAGQCCRDFDNAEAKSIGFGTENWQKILTQIYETANSLPKGFVIDLTLSQHWPVAFNNIDPNDVAQLQATRIAYDVITGKDVAAGVKTVPRQATRLRDPNNVPFIFVDHYAAATIAKVASVAEDGTPTFSYASLTDMSNQTSQMKNADGSPAGSAAGIMDQVWIDANPSSFSGNLTSGSTTVMDVSTTDGAQRLAGSLLSGPGIPAGTQVVSLSGSSIEMSNPATATTNGADIEARWNINTVDADWGPVPSDPDFTGNVDSAGDRRRMADWQYEFQTTLDPALLSDLGCTTPGPDGELEAGNCVLFGTWHQGTGQIRSGGVNTVQYNREYVVSVYDRAGTQSIIDFWENNILGTWENGRVTKRLGNTKLIELMKANAAAFPQASFFEDSFELSRPDGAGAYWASDVLDTMTEQLGYPAGRYAPVLAAGSERGGPFGGGGPPGEFFGGFGQGPGGDFGGRGQGERGNFGAPGQAPGGSSGAPGQAPGANFEGPGPQGGMPMNMREESTTIKFDDSIAPGQLPRDRVAEDWTNAMADAFANNHVAAIQKWAESTFGYNFRVQDGGGTGIRLASIESGVHEASADSGAGDNARTVAASAALTGSNWITAESLTFTKDYTNPWVDIVKGLNQIWSTGINRPEWHGTPYIETFNGEFSAWPGWEFQHGMIVGWGAIAPRQIYWDNIHGLTDYVARTQAVLQGGVVKIDLAVLQGSGSQRSPGMSSSSLQTLMDAGWSYHIINDKMIQTPNAVVTNGLLDEKGPTNGIDAGPAYQAIVVSGADVLQVATVKKLTEYADAGLPIILFNSSMERVHGTNQPDGSSTSLDGNNDTALAAAVATLKAQSNVYTIGPSASQQELLAKLQSIGLKPRASYSAPGLGVLQREDPAAGSGGISYYYLYNARTATSLQAPAAAGDTGIRIASTASEQPGDKLTIDTGANQEVVTIAHIAASDTTDQEANVILAAPLKKAHASGTAVSKRIDATVTLTGGGAPSVLNAWTGMVEPIARYTSLNGSITIDVSLESQEAMIVQTTGIPGPVHASSASGGSVLYKGADKKLVLRADQAGDYSVSLSNDQTRSVQVNSVPAAVDLFDGWSLDLESFGPDPTASNPEVSARTEVTFPANALGFWGELPATSSQLNELGVKSMAQVSGIGYYRNTFHLPSSWNSNADGAYLVFGHGNGDMVVAVTVNGEKIGTINQVTDRVDVGSYLRPGQNSLVVEINTNLGNRVGNRGTQNYGLTGVQFQPYTDAAL